VKAHQGPEGCLPLQSPRGREVLGLCYQVGQSRVELNMEKFHVEFRLPVILPLLVGSVFWPHRTGGDVMTLGTAINALVCLHSTNPLLWYESPHGEKTPTGLV